MRNALLVAIAMLVTCFTACASDTEPNTETNDNMEPYKMYTTVNGTTMTATMVANSSTAALREILKKGDITIDMSDYGNFEKVGELPQSGASRKCSARIGCQYQRGTTS